MHRLRLSKTPCSLFQLDHYNFQEKFFEEASINSTKGRRAARPLKKESG